MAAQVLDFAALKIARSDPDSEYERLGALLRDLEWGDRVRWKHAQELERQFVDDDLRVLSGPRKGRPLSAAGRRNRLQRLLDANREWHALADRIRSVAGARRRAFEGCLKARRVNP
jgi:hypothetical protein